MQGGSRKDVCVCVCVCVETVLSHIKLQKPIAVHANCLLLSYKFNIDCQSNTKLIAKNVSR